MYEGDRPFTPTFFEWLEVKVNANYVPKFHTYGASLAFKIFPEKNGMALIAVLHSPDNEQACIRNLEHIKTEIQKDLDRLEWASIPTIEIQIIEMYKNPVQARKL